jgi:hypothetical protein
VGQRKIRVAALRHEPYVGPGGGSRSIRSHAAFGASMSGLMFANTNPVAGGSAAVLHVRAVTRAGSVHMAVGPRDDADPKACCYDLGESALVRPRAAWRRGPCTGG